MRGSLDMLSEINNKINVLWVAFQPLTSILKDLGDELNSFTGGWLDGGSKQILEHNDINLSYCFSYNKLVSGTTEGITYYSMLAVKPLKRNIRDSYHKAALERFKEILKESKPDIIHIFGTETLFQRQFAYMSFDLGLKDRTVVWIQGLVGPISNSYTNGLTISQIKRKTFWELVRGSNIEGIQKRLAYNGIGEWREIEELSHVFTRTEWDSAWCKFINSNINVYICGETLRSEFYENELWNIDNVEKYSIFVSQYNTPIKGFHKVLRAMPSILRRFPDAKLYTTGDDILKGNRSLLEEIREASFLKIVRGIINELHLEDHVVFLGKLNPKKMRDRFIASHVFVSASTIENSPNSVGEAMILGVPVVASDVGGVNSMITHKIEGLLYPFNEEAMIAEYVCQIFDDNRLAKQLSGNARRRALLCHDKENNYENMLNGYRQIINKREIIESDN